MVNGAWLYLDLCLPSIFFGTKNTDTHNYSLSLTTDGQTREPSLAFHGLPEFVELGLQLAAKPPAECDIILELTVTFIPKKRCNFS